MAADRCFSLAAAAAADSFEVSRQSVILTERYQKHLFLGMRCSCHVLSSYAGLPLVGGASAAAGGAADGRRKRAFQLTAHEELQLQLQLELSFEEEKRKLEPERKRELARRLGIAPRQVAVWFQNRRARWRTKQLEQDFDRLRAAHDDLLAGRDALLADNDRLRSQVKIILDILEFVKIR
jgi:hypothetical protein